MILKSWFLSEFVMSNEILKTLPYSSKSCWEEITFCHFKFWAFHFFSSFISLRFFFCLFFFSWYFVFFYMFCIYFMFSQYSLLSVSIFLSIFESKYPSDWYLINLKLTGEITSKTVLQKLQWPARIPEADLEQIQPSKNYVFAVSWWLFLPKDSRILTGLRICLWIVLKKEICFKPWIIVCFSFNNFSAA